MTAQLSLAGEVGVRRERVEIRVIVFPDNPVLRSVTVIPADATVEQWTRQLVVPWKAERRTVVTYTSDWEVAS